MSSVAVAATALEDAVKAGSGLRVYTDPSASIDPPAVVLGGPDLYCETFQSAPTRAVFPLFLVTKADDGMLERLWDLVPSVAAAVEGYDKAAVQPGPWSRGAYVTGGTELPAYTIGVDVALEGE